MVALSKLKSNVGTGRITEEKMDAKIDRVKALIKKGLSTTRACYTVGIWVGQYNRYTGKVKPAKKAAAKKTAPKKAPAKKAAAKKVSKK